MTTPSANSAGTRNGVETIELTVHSIESGVEPQNLIGFSGIHLRDISVVYCVYQILCIFINEDYYLA